MNLEERIEQLEFQVELLFTNSDIDRLFFECKITRKQRTQIMNLMDSISKKVFAGEEAKQVKVLATVVEHGKGKKINIFTYKAKKNIRKRQGHRQPYTKLKVNSITIG